MKNVANYIDYSHINFWRKNDDKPLMSVETFTANDAQELFDSLENNLSPENLHCDGEISSDEANKKYLFFMATADELQAAGYRSTSAYTEFG